MATDSTCAGPSVPEINYLFRHTKVQRSSVPPAEIAILRDESTNGMGFGLGVLATLMVLLSSLRQARDGNKLAEVPRHFVRT